MNWNTIEKIETYSYNLDDSINTITSITYINFLDFFYLAFKIGLLVWLLFYIYKHR